MSSQLAKNTVFMTLASVAQKAIAFVYFLFLARIMLPEKTGHYFLATSVMLMFAVLTDLGLSSVLIRELAQKMTDRLTYLRRAITLRYALIGLSYVGLFIGGFFLNYSPQQTAYIWMVSSVLATDALSSFFYALLRSRQYLGAEAMGIVVGQSVTVTLGLIVLWLKPDVSWLLLAFCAGSFVNMGMAAWRAMKIEGKTLVLPIFDYLFLKRLIFMMIPFAAAGVLGRLFSSIDVVFISKLRNAEELGLYSIAYKFTFAFQFIPSAFAAALYPGLSSLIQKDKAHAQRIFVQAIQYLFLVSVPLVFGVWLMAPEMVAMLGHGYVDSVPVLRAMIFVALFAFLEMPLSVLLNAAEQQTKRVSVLVWVLIANLIMDVTLIPHIGVMGAVIGTLSGFLVYVGLEWRLATKIFPGFWKVDLPKTIPCIAVAGLIMLMTGLWLKSFLPWIMVVICVAPLYVIQLFLFNILSFERLKSILLSFRAPSYAENEK